MGDLIIGSNFRIITYLCVSTYHNYHIIIEAEWEDLHFKILPHDIFTSFDREFQFNLVETYFLCNEY